jgi:hypothetical protein
VIVSDTVFGAIDPRVTRSVLQNNQKKKEELRQNFTTETGKLDKSNKPEVRPKWLQTIAFPFE